MSLFRSESSECKVRVILNPSQFHLTSLMALRWVSGRNVLIISPTVRKWKHVCVIDPDVISVKNKGKHTWSNFCEGSGNKLVPEMGKKWAVRSSPASLCCRRNENTVFFLWNTAPKNVFCRWNSSNCWVSPPGGLFTRWTESPPAEPIRPAVCKQQLNRWGCSGRWTGPAAAALSLFPSAFLSQSQPAQPCLPLNKHDLLLQRLLLLQPEATKNKNNKAAASLPTQRQNKIEINK